MNKGQYRTSSPSRIGTVLTGLALLAAVTPAVKAAESLDHAVGIFVTQRGQQYFDDKFQELLFRNGYQFDQMRFPEWSYEAKESFSLDHLPPQLHKYQASLNEVRSMLRTWLVGFQLNDPRFASSAKDIAYSAQFSKFSLHLDKGLTDKYGGGHGAVFVIELVVPKFEATAAQIRGNDLNNKIIKNFGMNKVSVGLSPKSKPLSIQVPVLLEADGKGKANIEVLPPVTNFMDVTLNASFQMVLPKVSITIDGTRLNLDERAVQSTIMRNKANLLKVVQHYIQDYAETSLAPVINDLIAHGAPDGISEKDVVNPPGEDDAPAQDKYNSVLSLSEVQVMPDSSIYLGLGGQITDPRASHETAIAWDVKNDQLPDVSGEDPASYDMALNINESVINRMMQLSWERGLFANMKTESGDVVQMAARPRLIIDGSTGPNQMKFHLSVYEHESGIITNLFVKKNIVVEVDVITELERTSANDVGLRVVKIDDRPGKVKIDPSYIHMGTGTVMGKAYSAVKDRNKGYASRHAYLVDKLPIPPTIFGIPVRIKDFKASKTGFITLFLEYGE